jgi:hypothetical protein
MFCFQDVLRLSARLCNWFYFLIPKFLRSHGILDWSSLIFSVNKHTKLPNSLEVCLQGMPRTRVADGETGGSHTVQVVVVLDVLDPVYVYSDIDFR